MPHKWEKSNRKCSILDMSMKLWDDLCLDCPLDVRVDLRIDQILDLSGKLLPDSLPDLVSDAAYPLSHF